MFIELIDLLRCTREHEDSWLVATFHEIRERVVVDGLLSCPVCGARFAVTGGVAYFDAAAEAVSEPRPVGVALPEDPGTRLAAYLDLVEPGVVLLGGAWASAAGTLAELGNSIIAFNPVDEGAADTTSKIRSPGAVPIAPESLDGVALEAATATPAALRTGARALKTGARMLAPAEAPVPESLIELARDAHWWVAVREGAAASAPVQIARR